MKTRRSLTRASTEKERMVEVGPIQCPTDIYRGLMNVRWRYRFVDGDTVFEIAGMCECGAWWGWTAEYRLDELLELLKAGCPKCNA